MEQEQVIEWACEAGFQRHLAARIADVLQYVASQSAAAEREACGKARAGRPRELGQAGTGALLSEQQFCFDKGWKEGAAAVRKAIRARGNTTN